MPVVIADNGTVTKTTIDDTNWYNYDEAKWANAVILTGTDNYFVGQTIPEEAIESYFVWIPKYRYKLWDMGKYSETSNIDETKRHTIDLIIGDYDTKDNETECVSPNKSGDDGKCNVGKWMTHSAFTSLGVNGIWVGKFETGYKGSTDKVSAEKNEIAPEKVQIKPNINSWRKMTVFSAYNTSLNYKKICKVT